MIPPAPASTQPLEVNPEQGSRLAILHAAYADAKAKADSATKELKAVTDGIKLELTMQAAADGEDDHCNSPHPDSPAGQLPQKIRLTGPAGPPLALTWTVSKRLDTKRIQRELPAVYTAYTATSGAWQLREAKGGE